MAPAAWHTWCTYLIENLGEDGHIVVHILHKDGEVGLSLMACVRGAQCEGVAAALLVVQRPRQGNVAPVAQHPEGVCCIPLQQQRVGERRA